MNVSLLPEFLPYFSPLVAVALKYRSAATRLTGVYRRVRLSGSEVPINNAADLVGTGRNEGSLQLTPVIELKLDRGRVDVQAVPYLLTSVTRTASARVISASASWNARVDSAPWF